MGGVLPCLGKHAVVPVNVVRVEAQLALLGILLDGVGDLVSGQLHLGGGLLGDLADKVQEAISSVERHIMPCGHDSSLCVLEDAVLQSLGGTLKCNEKEGGKGLEK